MRKVTLLIVSLVFVSAELPCLKSADELTNRCQNVKRKLSPSAQRILSEIQLGFDAVLAGKTEITSNQLGVLARSKVRAGFPKANIDQTDSLVVILLSDWIVRQKAEILRQRSTKAAARPLPRSRAPASQSLNTDSELAMLRLNDLIAKANLVTEQMSKLLQDRNKTMEQVLDNF